MCMVAGVNTLSKTIERFHLCHILTLLVRLISEQQACILFGVQPVYTT